MAEATHIISGGRTERFGFYDPPSCPPLLEFRSGGKHGIELLVAHFPTNVRTIYDMTPDSAAVLLAQLAGALAERVAGYPTPAATPYQAQQGLIRSPDGRWLYNPATSMWRPS